jgi:hypothetical protein
VTPTHYGAHAQLRDHAVAILPDMRAAHGGDYMITRTGVGTDDEQEVASFDDLLDQMGLQHHETEI